MARPRKNQGQSPQEKIQGTEKLQPSPNQEPKEPMVISESEKSDFEAHPKFAKFKVKGNE